MIAQNTHQQPTPSTEPARLLSKKETAKILGLCERTVDILVARGKLRRTKILSRCLFDPVDIDAFIASCKA
jgi:hypothetical protein